MQDAQVPLGLLEIEEEAGKFLGGLGFFFKGPQQHLPVRMGDEEVTSDVVALQHDTTPFDIYQNDLTKVK
ncbi:hypothetical protein DC3_55690 [Deinococcus cellulosilyticus NBRC 106333 = KACC 11606]|uniref:Uncharacterized protein n=1 Tax=Deinococcus cellulosilyticus (strain DSM 18568 / NBRC 106333 / KACC 11606 / 5516J-15) TaxID=1223518 RepID=A0A511NAT0_DEIC1|nr:hypothetical protein DC3_55690 [Deinococcus cellulosilyticus NBRC 106333 = KACC 11606]